MAAATPGPDTSGDPASRFDLIVVGAGINGAAVAREAALAGLRVLLLEAGDIACGTSSASSRLVHGGLRYLEHGEIGLVRESLAERERLLRHAPHLVEPLALHIPVYDGGRRPLWQIRIGMRLYDWLSFDRSLPGYAALTAEELALQVPGLRRDGLRGGVRYHDARCVFPERLVLENVIDAVRNGAALRTYTAVTGIRSAPDGSVAGVDWRAQDGSAGSASAPLVVNAAGPWVDAVLGGRTERRLIGGTKGSHLITTPFPGAPRDGLYVEAGADGRPFFILPWNGLYLIGTTDQRFAGDPADARIDADEFDYLCAETERVLPQAAPLRDRVCYTHSGVRPLPYQPRGAEGAITRRHLLHVHAGTPGLYSVIGGKLTTHRALAEDTLSSVAAASKPRLPRTHDRPFRRQRPTRDRPLPGALPASDRDALVAELAAAVGEHQACRLWRTYGAAAEHVAARARDRELAVPLGEPPALLTAELVHAIEAEWATTLTDVLQRRTMIGLRADFGLGVAPLAAERLRRLGVWDAQRAEHELCEYGAYAAAHQADGRRACDGEAMSS